MYLAAPAGEHTNYGPYIVVILTVGFAVLGWSIRSLITSLGELRKEQNTQSSGLAVLVERINPVSAELADHDSRLRESENGLSRLEGALANQQAMTQHMISLQLGQRPSG